MNRLLYQRVWSAVAESCQAFDSAKRQLAIFDLVGLYSKLGS